MSNKGWSVYIGRGRASGACIILEPRVKDGDSRSCYYLCVRWSWSSTSCVSCFLHSYFVKCLKRVIVSQMFWLCVTLSLQSRPDFCWVTTPMMFVKHASKVQFETGQITLIEFSFLWQVRIYTINFFRTRTPMLCQSLSKKKLELSGKV